MTTHAKSTYSVKSWNEETCSEVDGHLKVTRADVSFAYTGDLEGEGAMQYLMLYRDDDASAAVIGLERITGTLAGRSGSFVLQHTGGYADNTASGDFEVVRGSASGDLVGLRGRGTATAHKDGRTEFSFDYDFASQ